MNKTMQRAMNWLDKQNHTKTKANMALTGVVAGVGAIAIGVISLVLTAVIITQLQGTAGINNNASTVAWIAANNSLGFMQNFTAQLPLAGTVLGFVLIFGGLAFLGYSAYNKSR